MPNDRMRRLDQWLFEKMGARCMWQEITKQKTIECFVIGSRLAIVIRYPGEHEGWDIFVPASDSGKIDETLAAAERALLAAREA